MTLQLRHGCLAVLLGCTLLVSPVRTVVTFVPTPLRATAGKAQVVVRGRLTQIKPQTYLESSSRNTCGTTYTLSSIETFKGQKHQTVQFSAYLTPTSIAFHEVRVGDEILVLLDSRTLEQEPESGIPTDVLSGPPSAHKLACLRQLPTLTLVPVSESAFPIIAVVDARSGKKQLWIAFSRGQTIMPDSANAPQIPYDENCTGERCSWDSRRMVPWSAVEAELRKWRQ